MDNTGATTGTNCGLATTARKRDFGSLGQNSSSSHQQYFYEGKQILMTKIDILRSQNIFNTEEKLHFAYASCTSQIVFSFSFQ